MLTKRAFRILRALGQGVGVVFESEMLPAPVARAGGEKRFAVSTLAVAAGWAADLGATAVGASPGVLRLALGLVVLVLPVVVWWAYARAPRQLRRALLLFSWAASAWLAGALVWFGVFLADGETVPSSPGVWDGLFACARLLVLAGVIVALRSLLSVRIAALETSVAAAAGIALGAALLGHTIEQGVSAAGLVTLNGPLLGIVTVILLAAAALGSGQLPRSLTLLALGEVALTIVGLISGHAVVAGGSLDGRWANLAAAGGAGLCLLAASAIVLDVDRPVRLPERGVPAGKRDGAAAAVLVFLFAIALTLSVAADGLRTAEGAVALIGLVTSLTVAVAMALRMHTAARARDTLQVANEKLRVANERLQRTNAGLRAFPLTVSQGFTLIDERTQGHLWDVTTQVGDDLAALVEELLDDEDS